MIGAHAASELSTPSSIECLGSGQGSPENLALREHSVDVGGRKLCVCSWGEPGKPVVFLLHGFQSHAGLWDKLGPKIARRGFHVVAPDRRGHGRSDWFETYNFLDYVVDIGTLINALGAARVSLVGHCESSLLAALFASALPERVRRLVLIQFPDLSRRVPSDTRAGLVNLHLQKSVASVTAKHPVFADPAEAVQRLLRDAPFQVPEAMARKVTPRNIKPITGGFTWRWDPAISRFRLLFDLIDVDLVSEIVKQITAETTLVFGAQSSLVAAREGKVLEFAQSLLPRAALRLVTGGHYPHMEDTLADDFMAEFAWNPEA